MIFIFIKFTWVTQYGDRTYVPTENQPLQSPPGPWKPMEGCTTPPDSVPPTLYEQRCGFFYVPHESEQ